MTALRECPFCGSGVSWCNCDDTGGCHRIECSGCGFLTDTVSEAAKAADSIAELREAMAKAWNKRADDLYTLTPLGAAMLEGKKK